MRQFFTPTVAAGSRPALQVVERDGLRYAQVIGLSKTATDLVVLAEVLIEDPPPPAPGTLRLDWVFADAGA